MDAELLETELGFQLEYPAGPALVTASVPHDGGNLALGWPGRVRFKDALEFFLPEDGEVRLVETTEEGVRRVDVAGLKYEPEAPSFVRLEAEKGLVVCANLDEESPAYDNLMVEFPMDRLGAMAARVANAIKRTGTSEGPYSPPSVERLLEVLPVDIQEARGPAPLSFA